MAKVSFKDFDRPKEMLGLRTATIDKTVAVVNQWAESSNVRILNIETLVDVNVGNGRGKSNETGLRVWYQSAR